MRVMLISLIFILLFSLVSAVPGVAIMANSVPPRLNQATPLSRAAANQPLHLLVWLQGQDPRGLAKLLHNLYTPGNPEYHKFITPEEYLAKYAPTPETVNKVKQYLVAQGLTVDLVPANNAYISVRTIVGQAEQAFATSINNYSFNDKASYSNDRAIVVDRNVSELITGISGLNNFAKVLPQFKRSNVQSAGGLKVPYTPQVMQSAYGANAIYAAGIDGSGQTIAIIDACDAPNAENDLNIYSYRYFLPTCTSSSGCFTVLNQTGGTAPPACSAYAVGWDIEVSLDAQSVHSLAPGAKIALFETESDDVPSLFEALNTAILLNYKIISNSWGYPEELFDSSSFALEEATLQQAAAMGISVNASSGDYADYTEFGLEPSVVYPASSTWVTAVGGSSLFISSDGRYINEVGWALPFVSGGFIWGSTGGLSRFFSGQPAQTNAIANVYAGGYGLVGNKRAVPDISMDGDGDTGIIVYDSNIEPAWFGLGGTSLSCPLFAAVTALANQMRSRQGLSTLGLVAPLLYTMPYSLHHGQAPITNIAGPATTMNSVLTAPPGWNDITGLGSPYLPLFVPELARSN